MFSENTLYLQYEASQDGLSGDITVAKDPLFFNVLIKLNTKSIAKILPSTSESTHNP